MSDRTKDIYFVNRVANRVKLFAWKSQTVAWCRCPICNDSEKRKDRRRFYFIKLATSPGVRCVCHNCGFGITTPGSLPYFLKLYFPDIFEEYIFDNYKKRKGDNVSLSDKLKKKFDPKTLRSKKGYDLSSCIPIDDLPETSNVVKYVDLRQIPHDLVMFCKDVNEILPDHQKLKRTLPTLIIPFYLKDRRVDVFQIRFFDPSVSPKYLTFKIIESAVKCYNLDFVDLNQPVFVMEGPIDSMFVNNAVAVAGSDLSTLKIPDPVFIFDNEPRATIINNKMSDIIAKGQKIVILPETYSDDVNAMIMKTGMSKDGMTSLLREYIFQGLRAKIAHSKWRKC